MRQELKIEIWVGTENPIIIEKSFQKVIFWNMFVCTEGRAFVYVWKDILRCCSTGTVHLFFSPLSFWDRSHQVGSTSWPESLEILSLLPSAGITDMYYHTKLFNICSRDQTTVWSSRIFLTELISSVLFCVISFSFLSSYSSSSSSSPSSSSSSFFR